MTLRFTDSFDHYATADLSQKWTTVGPSATISAGNGRRSTQSLRINPASSFYVVRKTIDAQATWIIGFAFKAGAIPTGTPQICSLLDAGTLQCELRIVSDGTLRVTRNGTTLGTSVTALSGATQYYIEFKVTISDAAGAYEVRVNGANVLSASSVDTKNTANATANQVSFGDNAGAGSSVNFDIDDVTMCDGQGTTNNNFLGDVRVDAYYPSGAGNTTQLTPSAGSNYQCVDETLQNGDTDYVQSSTASQKDTYAFADMTHTPSSIFGLQVNMIAKKDDAGARSICSVIRSGGTDNDGTTQAMSTSYVDYMQISETDPNTAAAWTKTNYNAAEFGVKVAA